VTITTEKKDIVGIVNRLLDAISLTITSQVGREGIKLRRVVGDLRAHFLEDLAQGTFTTQLLNCFTTARTINVELFRLAQVHQILFLEQPIGEIASAIVDVAIVFCLATESRMITLLEFKSRDDVEAMIKTMKGAFDQARELVAESNDSSFYQTLTFLAGALINHLATVARPLPRIIEFKLQASLPVLTASNLIYYNVERWEEIIDENHIVHPAFCPKDIRGLSS
jgi:prophage DNA circulation protein